jgi:murein biosynthesis integral membrane protein MurJ
LKALLQSVGKKINISVHKTIGTIAIINLILAGVAFLKDVFLASYLGTSSKADALLLAFFIPDTVGNNLLASAIGVTCIPIFSKLYETKKHDRLKRTYINLNIIFFTVSLLLALSFYIFRIEIIQYIGKGLSPDSLGLCINLFKILLLAMLIYPAISIGNSMLQVFERYNISSLAPVLFNSIFLAAILYCMVMKVSIEEGVYILAVSILLGVAAMFILTQVSLHASNQNFLTPKRSLYQWHLTREDISEFCGVFKKFIPYLGILLSTQGVLYVERVLASRLEVGSVSGLNYAYRLAQFPVWVFVAAISIVVYPSMSKAISSKDVEDFRLTLLKSLKTVFIITTPVAILLFFMREPIISTLLRRGAFDHKSLQITAGILAGYSLTIVGQSMTTIGIRAFLSIGKMAAPLIVFIFSALVNIISDIYLTSLFDSAGIGYGAALGAILNALLILILLKKEFMAKTKKYYKSAIITVGANLPVALIAFIFNYFWYLVPQGFFIQAGFIFLCVLACSVIYYICLRIYKVI